MTSLKLDMTEKVYMLPLKKRTPTGWRVVLLMVSFGLLIMYHHWHNSYYMTYHAKVTKQKAAGRYILDNICNKARDAAILPLPTIGSYLASIYHRSNTLQYAYYVVVMVKYVYKLTVANWAIHLCSTLMFFYLCMGYMLHLKKRTPKEWWVVLFMVSFGLLIMYYNWYNSYYMTYHAKVTKQKAVGSYILDNICIPARDAAILPLPTIGSYLASISYRCADYLAVVVEYVYKLMLADWAIQLCSVFMVVYLCMGYMLTRNKPTSKGWLLVLFVGILWLTYHVASRLQF
jgi:hypothetical protein